MKKGTNYRPYLCDNAPLLGLIFLDSSQLLSKYSSINDLLLMRSSRLTRGAHPTKSLRIAAPLSHSAYLKPRCGLTAAEVHSATSARAILKGASNLLADSRMSDLWCSTQCNRVRKWRLRKLTLMSTSPIMGYSLSDMPELQNFQEKSWDGSGGNFVAPLVSNYCM